MGTRADFYLGRSEDMKWVGSVAWDGYPSGIGGHGILPACSEQDFLDGVARMAATRDDFTTPENGWPWPWADSSGTDFAYAFDGGQVYVSNYGSAWVEAKAYEAGDIAEEELEVLPTFGEPAFPDMTDIQNVDFGKRSGVIIVGR